MIATNIAEAAVSLAEAQAFARVETGEEEALLAGLVRSASALCESFIGQVLIARPFEEVMPATSEWQRLALTPMRSIDGVSALATDGSSVALIAGEYEVDIDSRGDGWVRSPGARDGRLRVTGTAGLASEPNGVPEPLRQGILRLIAHLFATRDGDGGEPPAAANDGGWKPVPIELSLGSDPLVTVAATRRAVIGRADTLLYPRVPLILDELSTVDVKLSNPADILLNCDADALMAGANMALLGDELIQFGRAEHLGAGIYRLLRLLRGRRGTEWAAATHAIGEHFCLIDPAAVRPVDILASAAGVLLTATAHGVGDVPPLPSAQRLVSGESLRPVSPCHLKVLRESTALHLQWTRRSHRGWGWVDSVGDADDPFAELYRLTIAGPAGQMTVECATSSASVSLAELPAGPGQMVTLSVATVGPMVPSRAASTTFMI